MGLHHFADQVFGQVHIVHANRKHWSQVAQIDAFWHIKDRAFFQEFSCKSCKRAKQKRLLTIDHTGVKVRYGHWRCTYRSSTIYFCQMFFDNFRLLTNQPLTTYRESTIAFAFRNIRLLQQGKCATASAKEDKARVINFFFAGLVVFQRNSPALIAILLQIFNGTAQQ